MTELTSGTRVAHYEIVLRLGMGGMGEVYKAYDPTLERHIALKLLPLGVAPTDDALRRFAREAKAASGLNHPNIITVYEIGHAAVGDASVNYIAMELVEGKTLRDFLSGKFEMEKALLYLTQTAEGLAKAHAAGIVHRDLKPENIMITVDGYAKILDFGLAKSDRTAAVDSENATSVRSESITREGVVVGTIGYMSPEQVRGDVVDPRSDIFSLGCILYEVATHRQPFRGSSAVETLHKIAYEPPPPMTDARPPVTAEFQRAIRKSLAKDPEERYQSAKEMAIDLREIRKEYESGANLSAAQPRPPLKAPWNPRFVWTIGALALIVMAASVAMVLILRAPSDRGRFEAMSIERLPNTSNIKQAVLSPDGRTLAHVDSRPKGDAIVVRQLSSGSEIVAAPADGDPYEELAFSPDGEWLHYIHRRGLQQIPVLGGPPKRLIDNVTSHVTFAPDGKRCAFVRDGSLFVAALDGSNQQRIAGATKREFYIRAAWSPRGDVIACTKRSLINTITMWIEIIHPSDVDSVAQAAGHPTILGRWLHSVTAMEWLPDGSALIVSAQPSSFSERQLCEISYPAGTIRRITNDLFEYQGASINAGGTVLVSRQTDKRSSVWVVPVDHPENAKRLIEGIGIVEQVTSLPAGGFVYAASNAGNDDIWKAGADGTDRKQLTDDPHDDSVPAVSPDGRTITFASERSGQLAIWKMDADGSHPMKISSGGWDYNARFSPDGTSIVYTSRGSGAPTLWRMSINGTSAAPIATPYAIRPAIAPDGRMLAATDAAWRIAILSATDGKVIRKFNEIAQTELRWTKDSRSFGYSREGAVYLQNIDGSPPKKLADFTPDVVSSFDWTPDGKSILCARMAYQRAVVMLKNFR